MKIRHIYRWDDPVETSIYLVSYLFLWAVDHLLSAAVSCSLCHESRILVLMGTPPGARSNGACA